MMVMYDASPEDNAAYAAENNITYPILSDTSSEIFGRWDPSQTVPSTTIIDRGVVVAEVGVTWYQDLIKSYVYDE